MIHLSAERIFLYREAVDMRKGYDGLIGVVKTVLKENPLSGAYFVFLNGPRNRIKVLYWDKDGFAVWMKRLECGSFALPEADSKGKQIIDRTLLLMLLEGLKKVKRTKRFRLNDDAALVAAVGD
jgi:transposase